MGRWSVFRLFCRHEYRPVYVAYRADSTERIFVCKKCGNARKMVYQGRV